MNKAYARYTVGQLVHHKLFDYRGVIIDVDPNFQRDEDWYILMARSHPPKDQPWYHVLVDDTDYTTYVAEQNLEEDITGIPITHPELTKYFTEMTHGSYVTKRLCN